MTVPTEKTTRDIRQRKRGASAALSNSPDEATSKEQNNADFFALNGWLGPFSLLSNEECHGLLSSYLTNTAHFLPPTRMKERNESGLFDDLAWFKSLHTRLPDFFDLAANPTIIAKVAEVLGKDVIAWGATVTTLEPKQSHRWHVDVEHLYFPGVSVFVALNNVNPHSTLKVIGGSQHFTDTPQELAIKTDQDALKAARIRNPDSYLKAIDLRDGEFFLFADRVWHGSENTSGLTRHAAILQYVSSNLTVHVPTTWNEPIVWHPVPQPCVLVSGEARGTENPIAGRPKSAIAKEDAK